MNLQASPPPSTDALREWVGKARRSFESWSPATQRAFLEQFRGEVKKWRQRAKPAMDSPAGLFRLTYRNDPIAFLHDCFDWREGEGPTAYQEEIIAVLPHKKRVAVRGPHGLGKTTIAAWVVLWFALTRDGEDWKMPTTAGAWRQLEKYLWPEIHKWARKIKWEKVGCPSILESGALLHLVLKGRTGEAFAVASNVPALIEGAHADQLLYIFDESKAISAATFDAAEGAFSGTGEGTQAQAYALAISTPGESNGHFYDIHSRKAGYEDWWVRHITLDEMLAAGRQSMEWVEQRKKQWGEGSAVYQNRVLGEFASSESDSVIPLSWVELANERWHAHSGVTEKLTVIGVDVARSGEDQTVLAPLSGDVFAPLRYSFHEDTMATAGRVIGLVRKQGGTAVVDVIGIGAGVVDKLREEKLKVIPFNAGEASTAHDRSKELGFLNLRAEAWWKFREALDPAFAPTVALPPDDLLTGDLTAPRWKVTGKGSIQIESKDEIKKRIDRSTDSADAVIMAWWGRTKATRTLVLPFRM